MGEVHQEVLQVNLHQEVHQEVLQVNLHQEVHQEVIQVNLHQEVIQVNLHQEVKKKKKKNLVGKLQSAPDVGNLLMLMSLLKRPAYFFTMLNVSVAVCVRRN